MNPDRYAAGLQTRREVLGPDYVDQAIASADDFNRPMQELVTEVCWDGRHLEPARPDPPRAQPAQPGDAHRAEPPARAEAARARGAA